ncbi:MAG: UDP-glucose--hexose-1-phosphate uridylyltransferase [Pseudomonadota bacterium]
MTLSADYPHRRFNPLTGDWVLVSPHRGKRPWQGQSEDTAAPDKPTHDPTCYLCAGNTRVNGVVNPDYTGPFVFPNDFPALLDDVGPAIDTGSDLLRAVPVSGTARVICFSERHDLTLPELPVASITGVIDLWADQITELGAHYPWVAVFENKGAVMGCSNPHPHGQIWASDFIPNEIHREDQCQKEYKDRTGDTMLVDYAALESADGTRVVVENDDWVAVVPYWAIWPFETMVLPKRHILRLPDVTAPERRSLAKCLKQLCTRYDNLFETEFPYTMGWHGAPFTDGPHDHWQLHAHFYPPLLRSATVRKFMVGYEMLAEAQRDLTAETAAARLQDQSLVHYKTRKGA